MLALLSWTDLLIIWGVLLVAYTVFGMTGFGSVLIASPLLAFLLPVNKIIPLLALLDCGAAVFNTFRDGGANVSKAEIKKLYPLMILGSLLGTAILLYTKPDILLLFLGVFVTAYSIYALSGYKPIRYFKPIAVIPFGFIGGIFSALFGSGGFIYAIYLAGRLDKKETIRVTQSAIIGMSTITRIVLLTAAGVYFDIDYLIMVLLLAPTVYLGNNIGRRISMKVSKEQFIKIIYIVILFSGIAVLIRYFYA